MKRIILHAKSFDTFWAHYSLFNDQFFFNKFKELGFKLILSKDTIIQEDDFIIFIEAKSIAPPNYIFRKLSFYNKLKYLIKFDFKTKKNLITQSALLILEGVIDAPENHSNELVKYCKYIFTWNDDLVDNVRLHKIYWPQPIEWPDFNRESFSKKKLLTNISANKYSNHKKELYSARRSLINYCDKNLKDEFDLYGIGWNKPRNLFQKIFSNFITIYSSYKGIVQEKSEIFTKYKFAIIYENASVNGWITEKIFDCLRSDCVPIYLGAPNVCEHIPENIFIDRRKFENDKELIDYISRIDEIIYNNYRNNIISFLNSPKFNEHLSTNLACRLVEIISKNTKK